MQDLSAPRNVPPNEPLSVGTSPGGEATILSMYIAPKRSVLQKHIFSFIVLGTIWIAIGRTFFGAGGWGVLVSLFIWAPILVVCGFIVGLVSHYRFRRQGYIFSRLTQWVAVVVLAALFLGGLTFIDGGDTEQSIGSVLTIASGLRSPADEKSVAWMVDETMFRVAYYTELVSLAALLILVIADPGKPAVEVPLHKPKDQD